MVIEEKDLRQRLNLIQESPSFVFHETGDRGEADILTVDVVPKDDGIYWVAGTTTLKSGRELQSVFRVDTDSGGSLQTVFWRIGSDWYRHEEADALAQLAIAKEDAFPFDWRFAVRLEEDIFHDK